MSDLVVPGFLDPPEAWSRPETARFAVLPLPYDATCSYGSGTRHGPDALLAASRQVEWYDEELGFSPAEAGIVTLRAVEPVVAGPGAYVEAVAAAARPVLAEGRTLVGLGGEHTVSLGLIEAARERWDDLTVVQVDAHLDLRDRYQGSPFSHASVMRRVLDMGLPVVHVGARSGDEDEWGLVASRGLPCFRARELATRPVEDWVQAVVAAVRTPRVYLTVDLDGFDPSVIPGTGTPEPGGIGFWEGLRLFRALAAAREVVAFDVVELEPEPGSRVSEFAAAKITYKIMGYLAAGKRG